MKNLLPIIVLALFALVQVAKATPEPATQPADTQPTVITLEKAIKAVKS